LFALCRFDSQLVTKVPLKQYHIPNDLRVSLNKGQPSVHLGELLASEITKSNYQDKFSALMHIEELQMEVDIRHYDVDDATMAKEGKYLVLTVIEL